MLVAEQLDLDFLAQPQRRTRNEEIAGLRTVHADKSHMLAEEVRGFIASNLLSSRLYEEPLTNADEFLLNEYSKEDFIGRLGKNFRHPKQLMEKYLEEYPMVNENYRNAYAKARTRMDLYEQWHEEYDRQWAHFMATGQPDPVPSRSIGIMRTPEKQQQYVATQLRYDLDQSQLNLRGSQDIIDRILFSTSSFKLISDFFKNTESLSPDEERLFNSLHNRGAYSILCHAWNYGGIKDQLASIEKSYRHDMALDDKGESLLRGAVRGYLIDRLSKDIAKDENLLEKTGLSQEEIARIRKSSEEQRIKTEKEFLQYRDSLKRNKDGSLKLEDFGEDLNNTRKGRTVARDNVTFGAQAVAAGTIRERLMKEPLEKVWPIQSIYDLYQSNPEGAAFLYLIRRSIGERRPAPNSRKLVGYLSTAETAIAVHHQLLTGEIAPEAAMSFFDCAYDVGSYYKMWALIEPKHWPSMIKAALLDGKNYCEYNHLRLSDGSDVNEHKFALAVGSFIKLDPDKELHFVDQQGEVLRSYRPIVAEDIDELKQKLNDYLEKSLGKEKSVESSQKKELKIQLYGRGRRSTHEYEIYGKAGSIELQLTDLIAFADDNAFWKYVSEHSEELKNKYRDLRTEYSKTEKDYRSASPIRDRKGPDYRNGKDATPEMFLQAFGFRGVEFGNWVHQGKNGRERQWMLNKAYDALYDLSTLLGIPPKAVSLNGTLGLCFGSRGFGSASAHYEPDNKIINLTKTKGYSSLAHEWFHALDHYMARNLYRDKARDGGIYLSNESKPIEYTISGECIRRIRNGFPQDFIIEDRDIASIVSAFFNRFKDLQEGGLSEKTLKCTFPGLERGLGGNYRTSASQEVSIKKEDLVVKPIEQADKVRPELYHAWADVIKAITESAMHQRMLKKSSYWHSKIEEGARSFEAYVELRCKDKNILNDFLTSGAYSEKPVEQIDKTKLQFYPYLDGKDVVIVKEKFKALFEQIKSRETGKGVELYSVGLNRTGTPVEAIRSSLDKYFGQSTVSALIDGGLLKIVRTTEDARQYLSDNWSASKRNTRTGFIVPDALAHQNNPRGVLAYFNPKTQNTELPRGAIVVFSGRHVPFKHSGMGARHITGNVIEKNRTLYQGEANKTESALRTATDILSHANELYREPGGKEDFYHFYSSKHKAAVCTLFNGKNFVLVTYKKTENPEKIWGQSVVSLKGALEIPSERASAARSSSHLDTDEKPTEHQPGTAHEATYTDVDYTEEIRRAIESSKHHSLGGNQIQGFYSPQLRKAFLISESLTQSSAPGVLLHEIGVHMAYDKPFKEQMQKIIDQAPSIMEEGVRKGDVVAVMAKEKLALAGITPAHSQYKEEACAYLVESCALKQAQEPKLVQWYKAFKSHVSVWLYRHGFKECTKLSAQDLVTIARSNVKAIAKLNSRESKKASEHIRHRQTVGVDR